MNAFVQILAAVAPVLVAVVTIIPTVIANRKKTQETITGTMTETKKQIGTIQQTLNSHIREDEDEKARNSRYRILRFYDEICEGRKHSESHFEDILDDIDAYEKYCEAHPNFKNSRGHAAMQRIKDVYAKIKNSGGFLTHDED